MRILGTNFYGHDSSVFLLDTAQHQIFAISTERITRIKHDACDISPILDNYALHPIDDVSHAFGSVDSVDDMRFGDALRLEKLYRRIVRPKYLSDITMSRRRQAISLLRQIPAEPGLVIQYIFHRTRMALKRRGPGSPPLLVEYIRATMREHGIEPGAVSLWDHHLCHAASAYYFSPFANERAVAVTLDGSGDGHFSKVFVFDKHVWKLINASRTIAGLSLGFLYANFTEALGLLPVCDEGKTEALAAFGTPDFELLKSLQSGTKISVDGLQFLAPAVRFKDIKWLRSQLLRIGERDFAATVQRWLEDVVVEYLNMIHREVNDPDLTALCLAGGVCANVIMNMNILERTPFKRIYVFPGMGDDGAAAGAAVLTALRSGEDISWLRENHMPYFGNRIDETEIMEAVKKRPSLRVRPLGQGWQPAAAQAIAENKIVGIVHGRMEFGPRSLGNRSILVNPGLPDVRDRLNRFVKRRPWYQPFCPSILEEERTRLFESSFPHKHMAVAFRMRREYRERFPSAIHVDGTARAQFVEEADNPPFYILLKEIQKRTGFGVVINTSLNLHGRTIVRTAEDAIDDFLSCGIDELYIEGFQILK